MFTEPLLKAYLRKVYEKLEWADRYPELAQARVHRDISRALVGTRAGRVQHIPIYQGLEHYRSHLKLTTYQDYLELVRGAMAQPLEDCYFERGVTGYFGHSSSRTKYVPYTQGHFASFRGFQMDAAAQIAFSAGNQDIFSGRSFMIQGNLDVRVAPSGVTQGYSSAVMVEQTPWVLKRRLLPRVQDLRVPDLHERIERIKKALLKSRPRVLVGMPDYVAAILRLALEGVEAQAVREVLQGVKLYGWSGSTLGPHAEFLRSLFAPDCVFLDAVSATEGALGIRCADTGDYRFALNRSLLLFLPDGGSARDLCYAWELDEGQSYEVILGSFCGFLGYRLGDRIRKTGTSKKLRFELLARSLSAALPQDEAVKIFGPASDYYVYHNRNSEELEVTFEAEPSAVDLSVLALRLGARRTKVRQVPEGAIGRAGLRASSLGLVKLPHYNEDSSVHEWIVRSL